MRSRKATHADRKNVVRAPRTIIIYVLNDLSPVVVPVPITAHLRDLCPLSLDAAHALGDEAHRLHIQEDADVQHGSGDAGLLALDASLAR
jgi:hypothetical protein